MKVGGTNRSVVNIARLYEVILGRYGWRHLTV